MDDKFKFIIIMELIYSDDKYNYWRGFTAGCGFFYNVLPKYIINPKAGYPDSDYICNIKGVKNIFK